MIFPSCSLINEVENKVFLYSWKSWLDGVDAEKALESSGIKHPIEQKQAVALIVLSTIYQASTLWKEQILIYIANTREGNPLIQNYLESKFLHLHYYKSKSESNYT